MEATHPAAVTDATFPQEVEQHKGLVIVDFWATWCGPCHRVAPIMEQPRQSQGAQGGRGREPGHGDAL